MFFTQKQKKQPVFGTHIKTVKTYLTTRTGTRTESPSETATDGTDGRTDGRTERTSTAGEIRTGLLHLYVAGVHHPYLSAACRATNSFVSSSTTALVLTHSVLLSMQSSCDMEPTGTSLSHSQNVYRRYCTQAIRSRNFLYENGTDAWAHIWTQIHTQEGHRLCRLTHTY